MRVHGRSRREQAGLEFDARVPRLRPPFSRCVCLRTGDSEPARSAAEPRRLTTRDCRSAQGDVARCGARPRRRRAGRPGRLVASRRQPRRSQRAYAHREPRRPLPRRLPTRGFRAPGPAYRPATRPRGGLRGMELTAVDVRAWLAEDFGTGDLTSEAVVPEGVTAEAALLLKERGIVCGLELVNAVFAELDPTVRFEAVAADGDGTEGEVARVEGDGRALLGGERLALNVLGRLSGIATLTRRYVDAVAGTGATILDTRKTTPGLRALEKYAVRCGGGTNHRLGLDDGILIKDNHLRVAGSIAVAVERAKATGVEVEVECDTLDQVRQALDAGADMILLDNMSPPQLAEAVALTGGRAKLEA